VTRKTLRSQLAELLSINGKTVDNYDDGWGGSPLDIDEKSMPKNRTGKPVIWRRWIRRRKLPKDCGDRCCICGNKDKKMLVILDEDRFRELRKEIVMNKLGPPDVLKICKMCLADPNGE